MMHSNDNDYAIRDLADAEVAAVLAAFGTAMETMGFYDEEVADLLRLPVERLPLRPGGPGLSKWRETRVRHLLDIATALGLLIGDEDEIVSWLRSRNAGLDWMTPIDFMTDNEDGVACVRRMLLRESYHHFGPGAPQCML